jgi:hypothetical protein
MSDVRKVSPSAGAEWLMGGFALLRRSPLGLGLLGAIFGAITVVLSLVATASPALALAQQLVLMLLGPLLIAGLIWAAREVDQGRSAAPAHLLRGVRDGKAPRLWATLLPQIAALFLLMLLLVALVGPDQLQSLMLAVEKAQGQANPDPSLFADVPLGRLALWLLLAVVVGIVAGFFTFTAIPDMMFADAGAFAAMKRSFRACIGNLPALILFFVLLVIAAVALSFAVQLLGLVVRAIAGDQAMLVTMQVLLMAVLMPVVTGAMYLAWKQLIAGGSPTPSRDDAVVEA